MGGNASAGEGRREEGEVATHPITKRSLARNRAFTLTGEGECMDIQPGPCEHRWTYFVNVQSRAIRVRECERCHRRAIVPTQLEPLPRRDRIPA